MQADDPMLSMLRLAITEARAVIGQAARAPSFERDIARLCLIVTLMHGRHVATRIRARLVQGAAIFADWRRTI